MRQLTAAVVAVLFLTCGVSGQVTLTSQDIPVDPGMVMWFYVETDTLPGDTLGIPVEISPPGPDQNWDFTTGGFSAITQDSLFDPTTTAYADSFPDANRAQTSDVLFGVELGTSQIGRYESLLEESWSLVGVVVTMGFGGLPIEQTIPLGFDPPLPIMPFPLEMGDEWVLSDTLETIYEDTASGGEFLIRFEYGGFSEADAWGTALFEGGETECLRIHTTFGGVLNVYPMLFGQPFPIPIFTQEFPLSQTYTWVAPEWGEIATIVSLPGEEESLFEQASSIRRRTLTPTSAPENSVVQPVAITLHPAWPNPFNASTTIHFSLPAAGDVRIAIYNPLGRQVKLLADGQYSSGLHLLSWQPKNQASGVYFVRLDTDEISRTQRVILMK